jgi:antitoxin HigA-1
VEEKMPIKKPPHPGLFVKMELEELGASIADSAKALGITRQQLYNLVNCKSAISPEMAVRLAKGIGSTASTWLNLQQAFDLAQLSPSDISVRKIGASSRQRTRRKVA